MKYGYLSLLAGAASLVALPAQAQQASCGFFQRLFGQCGSVGGGTHTVPEIDVSSGLLAVAAVAAALAFAWERYRRAKANG